jgi:hypothetical protein
MGIHYKLSVQNIQTIIEGVVKVVAEKNSGPFPSAHPPAVGFDTGSRDRAFIF